MSSDKPKTRFATYIDENERREMEVMRAELGLPQKSNSAMQDRQILAIMRLATHAVMNDIRDGKRQTMMKSPMESDAGMPMAFWEDICDMAGVPQSYFERILNEDPRPTRKRVNRPAAVSERDSGEPSDKETGDVSD